MAIDLSTFWGEWDVVSGNTSATNQYEFWKGMEMSTGQILNNQYEFFQYHNTTRYEWFKNLQTTYPEVYDEYTFYKNTTDPNIFDYSTFYQYGGTYLTGGGTTTTTTTAAPISIGLIGAFSSWSEDVNMESTDQENWILTGFTISVDGGVKFRQDDSWVINWGSSDWPTGTAVQDGPNIPNTVGEFDISFNSTTGEFLFDEIIPPPPPLDPDAEAYLNAIVDAGGSYDGTVESAVDTLFKGLKNNNLYDGITIMYPMVGGTLPSQAINAVSPGTFNLTWYGTPSVNADGTYLNGGYGDPVFYADDPSVDPTDISVSVYVTVACTSCSNEVEWGGTTATSSYEGGFIFPLGTAPIYKVAYSNGLGGPAWATNDARFGMLNKVSSTSQNIWENGVKTSTQTVTTRTAEHQKQMLGSWYIDGGTPYYNSTKTIGFFHLGRSFSDGEAETFMIIVNTFNASLSRNIY